ncbi:hypothetical protein ATCVCanal1_691L [Acanthocystis turfacea Chlorella virus Canal-1]|nr:hypothetical protein ATCVCanal1_691L [Acanthocystis turfacea Chlorella virus Canal-1]
MPRCICGKRASFGFNGEKATYCAGCKKDGMQDVVHKRCPSGKQVSFGFPGGKALCCKECKEDGMERMTYKKCPCGKNPYFGFPGGKALCCRVCKEVGMEDVKSKKCPCGKQPHFGYKTGKPICCVNCKDVGMEDLVFKRCVCGKHPYFGYNGEKPTCCANCKKPDMEDIVHRRCEGFNGSPCPTKYLIVNGREYCIACDPDDSRRLDKKRDEAAFFNFLNKHITITQQSYPVHFRCIDTNKMRAEIDGIIITKDTVVCLELDEDAHEYYDEVCEEARMHNVSAELKIAYPDHSVAWVRVNPHTKKNGKRDKSSRALKIRDKRHQEALGIIEDILQNPRDCIEYIGY